MIGKFINWRYYIIFILIFSFVSILFTNQVVLRDFPNSADEYSYLISAELFSVGRLSVPSPKHKEFFDFFHIINDGRFYGKYSAGWPFFLMFGVILRFPMIINLIFAILTLILVYLIGKEVFSEKIGRIAILLMAISSYFIFNSASYFSHTSSLFFLSLFGYIYFKNLKSNKKMFFLGCILGISFNIRQLDTVVIGFCFLIHYIFMIIKRKKPIKNEINKSLLFLSGFLIFLSIFLLYNYLQTGNPFLMPFSKYNPYDKLGFNTPYSKSFSWAVRNNIFKRSLKLNRWVPFCFLFMFISLFKQKRKKVYFMFSIFCFLLLSYLFYAVPAGNEYGPRYIYSSSFAIFILMAVGLEKLKNKKIFGYALLTLIILNVLFFACISYLFHEQVNKRMELYDTVKAKNISNAIVFLNPRRRAWCSGTMPALDLTRNGIYFNNSVLYVHNMGRALMEDFPHREDYTWSCKKIGHSHIKFIDFWKSENIDCGLTKLKVG